MGLVGEDGWDIWAENNVGYRLLFTKKEWDVWISQKYLDVGFSKLGHSDLL